MSKCFPRRQLSDALGVRMGCELWCEEIKNRDKLRCCKKKFVMCVWSRRKKRVAAMCVGLSCNRFPLRVSFIMSNSFSVRWPYSISSSPRGKELHKTLSLSPSLSALFVMPSLILCAETGGRQGGKECVLLCFVCVSWKTHSVHLLRNRMTQDKFRKDRIPWQLAVISRVSSR